MWGLLRTRRWLSFTLAGLVAIAAFGVLSHWQWLRAQEEEAKSAAVAAGAAADPVPLASVLDPGAGLAEGAKWSETTRAWRLYFTKGQCQGCPLRAQCTVEDDLLGFGLRGDGAPCVHTWSCS